MKIARTAFMLLPSKDERLKDKEMAKAKNFSKFQIEQMAELYNSGKTLEHVAMVFQISVPTVRKNLKKSSLEVRAVRSYKHDPSNTPKMVELYNSGMTFEQVGDVFGTSAPHVRYLIRKLVKTRSKGHRAQIKEENN